MKLLLIAFLTASFSAQAMFSTKIPLLRHNLRLPNTRLKISTQIPKEEKSFQELEKEFKMFQQKEIEQLENKLKRLKEKYHAIENKKCHHIITFPLSAFVIYEAVKLIW